MKLLTFVGLLTYLANITSISGQQSTGQQEASRSVFGWRNDWMGYEFTAKVTSSDYILHSANQCTCQAGCHALPSCLFAAYSDDDRQCRLMSHLPEPADTELTPGFTWYLALRDNLDTGTNGDRCSSSADCGATIGPSLCSNNICGCQPGYVPQLHFCTLNAADGHFSEVRSGVADPGTLLATSAAASLADCEFACRTTDRCLVLVFADECSLYSGLQPRDGTTSLDTAHVWSFHRPMLYAPPSDYASVEDEGGSGNEPGTLLGRHFNVLSPEISNEERNLRCAKHGGILYPPENRRDVQAVFHLLRAAGKLALAKPLWDRLPVFIGLDVSFNSDIRVSTRSQHVTDLYWNEGEPTGGQDCHYISINDDFRLHDLHCREDLAFACEYVGEDIAKDRKWRPDGTERTVDLGEPYAIYGIRYMGSADAASATVKVSVALAEGQKMTCAEASPAMAAPRNTARLLACTDVTLGRFVTVMHEGGTNAMAENIAVFGSRLPGSVDDERVNN